MSRLPDGEPQQGATPERFRTAGLGLQVKARAVLLYDILRHPNSSGIEVFMYPETGKISVERLTPIQDFDPTQAEPFLPGWECNPIGPTIQGEGRPSEGEFFQEGWGYTRTFGDQEYRLDVVNKRQDAKWVSLSTGGVSELTLYGLESVKYDHKLGQLSFNGWPGGYHITDNGLNHFLRSEGRNISALKRFNP